jgi:phosphate transport system substrate-binding protein
MANDFNTDFNYITCPKCGHDRNPSTAKKCEICGQTLGKKGAGGSLPLLLAGGFGLLALLGAGYFGWRTLSGNPTTSPVASPTTPSSGVTSPAPNSPANPPVNSPSNNNSPVGKNELITGANPELYATFAQIPNVPSGTFNYGGSTTFAPLRSTKVLAAFSQAHPEFRLRYTDPIGRGPGSGPGIEMVINGESSFAQSSRPIRQQELLNAQQRGIKLEQVAIAIDGLAFYVNPQVNIPGLTLAQLKDIFTGKITNWQQVGGPNLPITAVSRDPKSGGTVEFFLEGVLQNQTLASNVTITRDTTSAIRAVAQAAGGIGYATAPEVIGQRTIRPLPIGKNANQLVPPYVEGNLTAVNEAAIADGSYPITRRLFIIIRRDGRLDEQAGVAYANMLLSKEGQDLIRAAGFAPVR